MKAFRQLQTIQMRLIIIYVLLILVAMQLIGVYFIRTLEDSFYGNFKENIYNEAHLLAEYVEDYLDVATSDGNQTYDDLNIFIQNLFATNNTEIQVIDMNGIIVSASGQQFDGFVGQKNAQLEVSRALQGIRGNERTMMDSDGQRKLSIAMPVRTDGKVIGAIYVVSSMEGLFSTMNRIKQFLFTGTLIALVLTALLGIILSNMITAPIKEITNKAAAMAVGNLDQQVHVLTGDEIGQLGLAFNDMTQRLREALFSIEEEKEKLASILSNMSDGVIAADEQRRVIVMNRRARAMLAIPADQSVEGQEVLTLLQLTAGEVSEHAWQQGAVHVVKLKPTEINEESLTAKITYSPIQRRGLGVIGTVLLLHDVTEQEQMETSRKEFVANVSHELRTPLTTIKSYLEALDEGVIEDPSLAQRFIGVTRNETERMIRLVTDLLHLSRLDSHQLKLRRETLNIVTILEEVADRFSVQASQRSMELIVESDIDELLVYADRDAIDQVLDNLISNAMKFSPKGGEVKLEAQRIDVNSTMPTEKIEISIRDQGTGIPKKDLDRIFERFYRVDKARSRDMGGTGLGLSIALEIVKAHGGTIRIDSQVGAGTRVVFTLPTKPGERERR